MEKQLKPVNFVVLQAFIAAALAVWLLKVFEGDPVTIYRDSVVPAPH